MRSLRLTLIAAALLLVPAGTARATDYCVSPETGCSAANTFDSIQPALSAAQAPGYDRVLIGSGTFDLPANGLVYNGDRVDVIGHEGDWPVLRQQATATADSALDFIHMGGERSM